MAVFRVEGFAGTVPRVSSHLLPGNAASTATNCKLFNGTVRPWKAPATVYSAASGIKTLRRYDPSGTSPQPKFLAWTADVDFAPSLIPGDTLQRVFWTDGVKPKQSNKTLLAFGSAAVVTNTANHYPLGMPTPTEAPGWTLEGEKPAVNVESRAYVYAWVHGTTIGAKSADIAASAGSDQSVLISGLDDTPPATFKGNAVKASTWSKWIFAVDAVTASYVLLAKLPFDAESYQDDGNATATRYKAAQFGKGGIPVPDGTATATTVDSPAGSYSTRSYVYCFAYKDADGNFKRSAASAVGTLANVLPADKVWVRAMATAPSQSWPAGATNKHKNIYRADSSGAYRKIAEVPLAQMDFLDDKKALGKNISTLTPSATLTGAPSAPALSIDGDDSPLELSTRYYVYTYVSDYGEESAPSPLSLKMEIAPYQTATINTGTQPSGHAHVQFKRVYRTDAAGNFRLVADNLPVFTATFVDELEDEELGEVLRTTDWLPPPDKLRGLTVMPNGILAGFLGNDLYFCEPYVPYAWPLKYRLTTDWPIVAIAMSANGLVVATEGKPYICQGSDSASMSLFHMEVQQACVAKRSMVDMGDYAIYASPDGLVAVDGQTARVITEDVITREQWQAYKPSSMHAYLHERRYLVFYDTGTSTGALLFDPETKDLMPISLNVAGGYSDPLSDEVYVSYGATISKWDAGLALNAFWRSKRFLSGPAICPVCARVLADSYPVTFQLWVDGQLSPKANVSVTSARPFRLPAGYRANAFEVEVVGTREVRDVVLATNMDELERAIA